MHVYVCVYTFIYVYINKILYVCVYVCVCACTYMLYVVYACLSIENRMIFNEFHTVCRGFKAEHVFKKPRICDTATGTAWKNYFDFPYCLYQFHH